jgi:hypothetical protein
VNKKLPAFSKGFFSMRAWVQQIEPTSPYYLASVQAAHWFGQRGYEIIPFHTNEIELGRLDEDLLTKPDEMVLRGGVGTVCRALVRAGRPYPPHLDLPESLAAWQGRQVRHSTLGVVRREVETPSFKACHIKPTQTHKLFTGMVVRAFRDLIPTAHLPDDVPILLQGFVEFVSEWRASVLRDRIVHVGYYRGDPLLFPAADCMRSALDAFHDRPIACAMDWGVTRSGETLLVEVNDAYSLGNYGVRGPEYTAMIEARWRELMGLKDNGAGRNLYEFA